MVLEAGGGLSPGQVLGLQPLLGPDQLLNLVTGLLGGLVDHAIQAFSVVTEYYDPLAWVKRRILGGPEPRLGDKEPAAPSDR